MYPASRHPLGRSVSSTAAPAAELPPPQGSGLVPDWVRELSKYEKPDRRKAIGQILDTFVPYAGLWVLMIWMLRRGVPYAFTLPLIVIAAGLVVRIFIVFHDCCHGSYFRSRRANRILGYIAGALVFTPYEAWQHPHAIHHATAGDLGRRGSGDIWTMTVEEYVAAPRRTRVAYRIFRNPLVMFVLGPPLLFIVLHRLPHAGAGKRERNSVSLTNIVILSVAAAACMTLGWRTYLSIQVPITFLASVIGVWAFYVQHQFEAVYWARHEDWDPMRAAMEGSSFYRLPKVLNWFTGNIGLHHVHHLRPRIPNYNLQKCLAEIPLLQTVEPLTLGRSLRSLWLNLWDEAERKMVAFRDLRVARGPRGPLVHQGGARY